MNKDTMSKISAYAQDLLRKENGFCGVAEGDHGVMINSTDAENKDIVITIKIEE